MVEVLLRCPRPGCGVGFDFVYDPKRAPFAGEGAPAPFGQCPNGHRFTYARRFKGADDRWLFTVFDFQYELSD
jgi:hypothetical protein